MRKKTLPLTNIVIQAIALAFFAGVSNANNVSHHSHGHTDIDFGIKVENYLKEKSKKYFGIKKPLEESAPRTEGAFRTESQSASDQVLLAKGLKAEFVTRDAGNKTDMMALWPQDNPTPSSDLR